MCTQIEIIMFYTCRLLGEGYITVGVVSCADICNAFDSIASYCGIDFNQQPQSISLSIASQLLPKMCTQIQTNEHSCRKQFHIGGGGGGGKLEGIWGHAPPWDSDLLRSFSCAILGKIASKSWTTCCKK